MSTRKINIDDFIDHGRVGPFQGIVIGLCACLAFLDGFDAQIIGFVAPVLVDEWQLAPGQMGPVFSLGLMGMMLGALFIAPLADRFGRRPIILMSTLAFGIFSLATVLATSVTELSLLRFLTGVGLGGCLPNTISLTSEYSPKRHRSLLIMLMFSGFTVGSLCGGLLSGQLMEKYGWEVVFIIGGVLPILLALLAYFVMPESIRILLLTRKDNQRLALLLRKVNPAADIDATTVFETRQSSAEGHASVGQLFRHGRVKTTIVLWIIFFMSLLDIYLLVSWLPTALTSGGATLQAAVTAGIVLQLGALTGPVPLGILLDRIGARATLAPAYLLGAVCIASIGVLSSSSVPLTLLVVFGAGLGVLGGQVGANAVAAASYPTHMRSTGVGWALGIGRIGSIVGPALAGILFSQQVSIEHIFFLSAIPAVFAALAALFLGSVKTVAIVAAKDRDAAGEISPATDSI